MIRASVERYDRCSLAACGHVIGMDVQRLRRAQNLKPRTDSFYELSRLGRRSKTKRMLAAFSNPFSPEFAKYFQGALWMCFAAAVLITVVHNIHW